MIASYADLCEPVILDFESRSRAKLKGPQSVGGRRYWEHPSTEALCCVAYDTRDGSWHLWIPGDPTPSWAHGDRVLAAHNAQHFDRFGGAKLGWRAPEWLDTSSLARRAGLPGALDELASRRLGRRKDHVGSRFTISLSRVSTAKARLGQWQTVLTPEVLARVVAYCETDVRVLVDAWPWLKQFLDFDEPARRLNATLNDRGVGFDEQLARRLLAEDERHGYEAIDAAARAWGESFETTRKLVKHAPSFSAFLGLPNSKRPTLEAALLDEWGENKRGVEALIKARLAVSSIAGGKLRKGLLRVCPDGRLRDQLLYYGGHTGRESSIGMQLHNMPRPSKDFDNWGSDEVENLAELVLGGRSATPAEVALLVRACLWTSGEFAVCDFSGVEARSLAWMAGDYAAIQVFDAYDRGEGPDVYKVFAGTMFGVDPASVTKTQRGLGKVGELACGFGMGWKKLHADKGAEIAAAGSSAQAIVSTWRDLHSPSVAFWYELERAWQAAAQGDEPPEVGEGLLDFTGAGIRALPGSGEDEGSVALILPSGRPLIYPDARVDRGTKGRLEGSYRGTKHREHVYGGKLVENVVQADCREQMIEGLELAERLGLNPVLDAHDEIVCETDRGRGKKVLAELRQAMLTLPECRRGFPIGAEGFVGRRYRK